MLDAQGYVAESHGRQLLHRQRPRAADATHRDQSERRQRARRWSALAATLRDPRPNEKAVHAVSTCGRRRRLFIWRDGRRSRAGVVGRRPARIGDGAIGPDHRPGSSTPTTTWFDSQGTARSSPAPVAARGGDKVDQIALFVGSRTLRAAALPASVLSARIRKLVRGAHQPGRSPPALAGRTSAVRSLARRRSNDRHSPLCGRCRWHGGCTSAAHRGQDVKRISSTSGSHPPVSRPPLTAPGPRAVPDVWVAQVQVRDGTARLSDAPDRRVRAINVHGDVDGARRARPPACVNGSDGSGARECGSHAWPVKSLATGMRRARRTHAEAGLHRFPTAPMARRGHSSHARATCAGPTPGSTRRPCTVSGELAIRGYPAAIHDDADGQPKPGGNVSAAAGDGMCSEAEASTGSRPPTQFGVHVRRTL